MIDLGDRDTSEREQFFSRSRKEVFYIDDAPFTLFFGEGFAYELYRQEYLAPLRESVYLAELLGVPAASCTFNNTYFGNPD